MKHNKSQAVAAYLLKCASSLQKRAAFGDEFLNEDGGMKLPSEGLQIPSDASPPEPKKYTGGSYGRVASRERGRQPRQPKVDPRMSGFNPSFGGGSNPLFGGAGTVAGDTADDASPPEPKKYTGGSYGRVASRERGRQPKVDPRMSGFNPSFGGGSNPLFGFESGQGAAVAGSGGSGGAGAMGGAVGQTPEPQAAGAAGSAGMPALDIDEENWSPEVLEMLRESGLVQSPPAGAAGAAGAGTAGVAGAASGLDFEQIAKDEANWSPESLAMMRASGTLQTPPPGWTAPTGAAAGVDAGDEASVGGNENVPGGFTSRRKLFGSEARERRQGRRQGRRARRRGRRG